MAPGVVGCAMDGESQPERRTKPRLGTREPVPYPRRDGCRFYRERQRHRDQRHVQARISGSPQAEELSSAGPDRVANRPGGAGRRVGLVMAQRQEGQVGGQLSPPRRLRIQGQLAEKGRCGCGGGIDRALVLQHGLADLLPGPFLLRLVRRAEAQDYVADDLSRLVRRAQSGPIGGADRRNELGSRHAAILAERHRAVHIASR
jgi:hypothetical protein